MAEGRYVNRGVFGAVTAVRESDFASGRHVLRATLSVDAREVARAPVTGFTAPIHPRRESVLPGPVREGPRFTERTVVVRSQPPAQRARFDGGVAPRAPMVRIAPPARSASPRVVESQPVFRDDRPRRVPDTAPQAPPQPRPVEAPRRFEPPQRVEQPRPVEPARRAEPQRVEQPRPVEPARRAEPQRVEQPAPAARRQESQERRGERRSERKEDKKQQ